MNQRSNDLLHFSIQHGKEKFQKENFMEKKIDDSFPRNSSLEKKENTDTSKIILDGNLNPSIQEKRKKIISFKFSENDVVEKNNSGSQVDSAHSEYVQSQDRSIILQNIYQNKLKNNIEEIKKNFKKEG